MGLINTDLSLKLSMLSTGFPSGPVVKNPLANAGDTGFDPGSGRSHMLLGNEACVPQPLSWHGAVMKPSCLEPVLCNKISHCNQKPTHCNEE